MVNLNRPFGRGFTIANFDEADSEIDLPDHVSNQLGRGKSIEPKLAGVVTGVEEAAVRPEFNMMRRGSKSLPASPMGSPKAVRKNPYFTGIFTSAASQNNNTEHQRWVDLRVSIPLHLELIKGLSFQWLVAQQFVGSSAGGGAIYNLIDDKYRGGDGTWDGRVRGEWRGLGSPSGAILDNHISIPGHETVRDPRDELLVTHVYVDYLVKFLVWLGQ